MSTTAKADGFIKFRRSPESEELLHDSLSFGLLAVIASRARWRRSRFSSDGLEPGEAFIGDHKNYGMTRQQYRTRVDRLVKWRLISIRPTRKGTIAKLTSTDVFDINIQSHSECLTNQKATRNQPSNQPPVFRGKNGSEQPSVQPANNQRTTNKQPLTKNERKEESNNNDSRGPETHSLKPFVTSSSVLNLNDAEKHPYWKQFTAFCKSQDGLPTLKGFNTWVKKQPPLKPKSAKSRTTGPEAPAREISDEERAALVAKFKAFRTTTNERPI